MNDKVIIMGSARNDGETIGVVNKLHKQTGWDVVNLNDYEISQYDYKHQNRDDDFLPLMRKILDNYRQLIFVTPVYWYAMSGMMKIFFDRFTDLLTIEKDLGRQLRGKQMAALSCSYGNNLGEVFWLPFQLTAEYLGMEFHGGIHVVTGKDELQSIKQLIQQVEKKSDHQT